MIPAQFDYASPESLKDALTLLAGKPDSKVLAGGQSLIPILKLRLAEPAQLIWRNARPRGCGHPAPGGGERCRATR